MSVFISLSPNYVDFYKVDFRKNVKSTYPKTFNLYAGCIWARLTFYGINERVIAECQLHLVTYIQQNWNEARVNVIQYYILYYSFLNQFLCI